MNLFPKSPSCYFSPFAFWVSLLISVLFRQYLWINSTQSLQKVRLIRVSDWIVSPDQLILSKNIIILQGIKIISSDNYRYKSETSVDFIGRRLIATGNPVSKSPTWNFADFAVEDAKIDVSGARPSWLTTAKISFFSLAASARSGFAASLASLYSGREADIMAGILLGSRDGFPADFTRKLRQSGLMHLAAASGYNISIVVGVFGTAIARLIGIKDQIFRRLQDLILYAIKVIIIIGFILFYIVISGGQASVVRAGLMGMVGFAATLAGSAASVRRLFLAAVLGMLLVKPAWLWDLGFQLSVAATAGMIWLVPLLTGNPEKPDHQLKSAEIGLQTNQKNQIRSSPIYPLSDLRPILADLSRLFRRLLSWKPLVEPLAASLATAPVLIINLGWQRLSLTGIPANVLATPLVAPLMACSAVVGTLGLLVRPVPALAPLSWVAAVLTRPLVSALLLIIDLSAAANEKLMAIFTG